MRESDPLEEEDSIQDMSEPDLLEEEDLIQDISTCSGCFSTPSRFRGFGIQEGGPTLAQDAERKVMDTIIGMLDPRILETWEVDEIEDHRLDPRPYHKDFGEFVQMQEDRMCAGAIDDGREVAVGSYMSPESVLRMLMGLAPTDIFGPLGSDARESPPEKELGEPDEVVCESVPGQVDSIQAVAV
jgi:hypothetical protein